MSCRMVRIFLNKVIFGLFVVGLGWVGCPFFNFPKGEELKGVGFFFRVAIKANSKAGLLDLSPLFEFARQWGQLSL